MVTFPENVAPPSVEYWNTPVPSSPEVTILTTTV
jgi:hypothetical protein